jgi:hypothetical protein
MSQLRERWTGVSLPGDYLLQQWLSGDEAAGFFETSLPPDGRRAVVKLVPELSGDGAAQLALWRRTRSLRHPNLLQLLDCGRAELLSEIAVYAVFEYADDTLARALAQAPLSEAEAREVLDAVLPALRYLQAHGLTLAALDPDRVLGVGEAIKLSTDRLREASPDTPYTTQLRAFWNRISPFAPARSADILAQALGADPHTGPAPARAEIAPAADAAVRPAAPAVAPPASRPFPKWPLLAAAGVVLLILFLNPRPAPETPAQPAPAPAPVPEAPAPPALAPSVAPADAKPSPAGEAVSTPASNPAPAATGMWRVIAFTFRTYDDAARTAGQINQRYPDFEAAVFSPPEKKGYSLVSLGGPMSREDAVRLQGKARAEGLARDVYIKKFLD